MRLLALVLIFLAFRLGGDVDANEASAARIIGVVLLGFAAVGAWRAADER